MVFLLYFWRLVLLIDFFHLRGHVNDLVADIFISLSFGMKIDQAYLLQPIAIIHEGRFRD